MSKGSRRRPENQAAIDANWPFAIRSAPLHTCVKEEDPRYPQDCAACDEFVAAELRGQGLCGNYAELGGCRRKAGHKGNCGDQPEGDSMYDREFEPEV